MKATAFKELPTIKLVKITKHALERICQRNPAIGANRSIREVRDYLTRKCKIKADGEYDLGGMSLIVRDFTIITIYHREIVNES